MKLTDRELGTVLAALRLWQGRASLRDSALGEIASCGGEYEALNTDEIDDLCQRLCLDV